ncbi:hypothetical protein JOM56_015069 [Amanita muscaria]
MSSVLDAVNNSQNPSSLTILDTDNSQDLSSPLLTLTDSQIRNIVGRAHHDLLFESGNNAYTTIWNELHEMRWATGYPKAPNSPPPTIHHLPKLHNGSAVANLKSLQALSQQPTLLNIEESQDAQDGSQANYDATDISTQPVEDENVESGALPGDDATQPEHLPHLTRSWHLRRTRELHHRGQPPCRDFQRTPKRRVIHAYHRRRTLLDTIQQWASPSLLEY